MTKELEMKLLRAMFTLAALGAWGAQAQDVRSVAPALEKYTQERLLGEFARRVGDPNLGGTRGGIMTAYRQTALEIARFLRENGATKASSVACAVGEPNARAFLYRDVYGWFERASVGVYVLSPRGAQETALWEQEAPRRR